MPDSYRYGSYGPERTVDLGPEPTLHDPVRLVDADLGAWTEVRPHARLHASTLGAYSYLMERVQLDYAAVGRFCSVASAARLGPTNHPIDRPTSHHLTYRAEAYDLGADDESVFAWRADHPVRVGHDVWIGHGATVLPDVSIGTGAVVGAGAVVTRDVPPYAVVAGVPAERIGDRLDRVTAARVAATEWWTWDHETLGARLDALRDADRFLRAYAPPADEVDVEGRFETLRAAVGVDADDADADDAAR